VHVRVQIGGLVGEAEVDFLQPVAVIVF
jgi:hypothetical protein